MTATKKVTNLKIGSDTMNIDEKTYVVIGIFSTAMAQISLKIASAHNLFNARWTICLLLSLVAYVVSFSSYYMSLKFFDISKIQPIMMASITSIIAVYGFASGESFDRLRMTGVMLSVLSIFLISKS